MCVLFSGSKNAKMLKDADFCLRIYVYSSSRLSWLVPIEGKGHFLSPLPSPENIEKPSCVAFSGPATVAAGKQKIDDWLMTGPQKSIGLICFDESQQRPWKFWTRVRQRLLLIENIAICVSFQHKFEAVIFNTTFIQRLTGALLFLVLKKSFQVFKNG